jgi:hypothetical protein
MIPRRRNTDEDFFAYRRTPTSPGGAASDGMRSTYPWLWRCIAAVFPNDAAVVKLINYHP